MKMLTTFLHMLVFYIESCIGSPSVIPVAQLLQRSDTAKLQHEAGKLALCICWGLAEGSSGPLWASMQSS